MKPIFAEFICYECGKLRRVKVNNVCIDCRDKKAFDEIIKESKLIFSNVRLD